MPRARAAAGFTLLEALVTLVVVSLIITLLMQALSQSLDLRARLLRHEGQTRVAGLQEQWFRDTVGSAMPDLADALGAMKGNRDGFELVTPQPLAGPGLERVRWQLQPVDGGWSLHYADSRLGEIEVLHGPLDDAVFEYLDGQGEWVAEWNPPVDAMEVLPRMVRLRAVTSEGELLWLVPLAADPLMPVMLRPQGGDRGL